MNAHAIGSTAAEAPGRPAEGVAVDAVWEEFSGELRTFIGRRVSRPQDVDDILQLVALRLTQNAEVDRDRKTLLGWLYAVTRNAITDHYRSAIRRREVATDEVPERPTVDLSDEADAEQALAGLASCVRPLMQLLPEDQAAAVDIVDLNGVSQGDAARRAGISVSGMKSRVQRGRRALQDLITACCEVSLDVRGAVQEFRPLPEGNCPAAAGDC